LVKSEKTTFNQSKQKRTMPLKETMLNMLDFGVPKVSSSHATVYLILSIFFPGWAQVIAGIVHKDPKCVLVGIGIFLSPIPFIIFFTIVLI